MINKSCNISLSGKHGALGATLWMIFGRGLVFSVALHCIVVRCDSSVWILVLQKPDCYQSSGGERESEKIRDDDREKVHPGPTACPCMHLPGCMAGCVCMGVRVRMCMQPQQ